MSFVAMSPAPASPPRIPIDVLAAAINDVAEMDIPTQLALFDEIVAVQPNLVAAHLAVINRWPEAGGSELLLNVLMVCHRAMLRSGKRWALVTESEQERYLTRWTKVMKFAMDSPAPFHLPLNAQFIDAHPEQPLLAYVVGELNLWQARCVREGSLPESGKYVMMAALNTVECLAYGQVIDAPTVP